jgi:hypothetical protein
MGGAQDPLEGLGTAMGAFHLDVLFPAHDQQLENFVALLAFKFIKWHVFPP